jgi:hypothetical protein
LQGPFPALLAFHDSLLILDLANNGLWGPLPDAVGMFRNLYTLSAANNSFNGSLSDLWTDTGVFQIGVRMAGRTAPCRLHDLLTCCHSNMVRVGRRRCAGQNIVPLCNGAHACVHWSVVDQ